jgi:hypothetical protein
VGLPQGQLPGSFWRRAKAFSWYSYRDRPGRKMEMGSLANTIEADRVQERSLALYWLRKPDSSLKPLRVRSFISIRIFPM